MSEIKIIPIRYDYNYLQQYCNENKIILIKDYSTTKVCRDTIIETKCIIDSCNESSNRNFRNMVKIGCYCIKHTEENRRNKFKQTNLIKFGTENPSQSEEIKSKKKQTCLKNHGVECSLQSKDIREKGKKTSLQKYGVENPMQNTDIQNKARETNIKKLGVPYPQQSEEVREKTNQSYMTNWNVEHISKSQEIKNKKIQTSLKNHGVEHTQQSEEVRKKTEDTNLKTRGVKCSFQCEVVKEKIKETNLERYGVSYPQQNAEISEKTSKSALTYKNYVFPSGRIERIQGYENFMVDDLLKEGISEEDIILKRTEVPICWYKDENGKDCRYYVDCFIKSQNRCIEAKSNWTAEKKQDCIYLKQQALKDAGYKCEIWVYNGKGEKVECYK